MRYYLMHKDMPVCIFDLQQEVTSALLNKNTNRHLPLPLKRIIHYEEEFIEEVRGDILILNEDGCALIDFWLNDRTIPANRKNRRELYTNGKSVLAWMLENHSCSLDDCYWTKTVDEQLRWDDVKLYGYQAIDILTQEKLASKTRHYSGVNSTLGGELEKYWFCDTSEKGKSLYLCKRTSPRMDILAIREILANLLYQSIGYENYCKYQYVYDREKRIVGCYCPAFTSENKELITAYDLLEEYNYTQQNDLYPLLVSLAAKYGLPEEETRKYLNVQCVIDYLITNRDRHQGNVGFLRNPDTLELISVAPVYDSGSSEHMEDELPIQVEDTRVNGLYSTETECLKHVTDFSGIECNSLPDQQTIRQELDKSCSLTERQKDFWEKLYAEKKEYIKQFID